MDYCVYQLASMIAPSQCCQSSTHFSSYRSMPVSRTANFKSTESQRHDTHVVDVFIVDRDAFVVLATLVVGEVVAALFAGLVVVISDELVAGVGDGDVTGALVVVGDGVVAGVVAEVSDGVVVGLGDGVAAMIVDELESG